MNATHVVIMIIIGFIWWFTTRRDGVCPIETEHPSAEFNRMMEKMRTIERDKDE